MQQGKVWLQLSLSFVILLILILVGYFMVSGSEIKLEKQAGIKKQKVSVVTVSPSATIPQSMVYAHVHVRSPMMIRSDVEGHVKSIKAHAGEHVSQGDVLLNLSAEDTIRLRDQLKADALSFGEKIEQEKIHQQHILSQLDYVKKQKQTQMSALSSDIALEKKMQKNRLLVQAQLARILKIEEKKYQRQLSLVSKSVISDQALDQSEQSFLNNKRQFTEIQGLIDLYEDKMTKYDMQLLKIQLDYDLRLNDLATQKDSSVHRLNDLGYQLEKTHLRLEQMNDDIRNSVLQSPVDGIIEEVLVSEGGQVNDKDILLKILPKDAFEVRGPIPVEVSHIVSNVLSRGGVLSAMIDDKDQPQALVLSRLIPTANSGLSEGVFRFTGSVSGGYYYDGLPVVLKIDLPKLENTYLVNQTSIYPGDKVYIVDQNDKLQEVIIEKKGYRWKEDGSVWAVVSFQGGYNDASYRLLIDYLPNILSGMPVEVIDS